MSFLFFTVVLYILFFIALINPQTRQLTIKNITQPLFEKLRRDYVETLSCPCSNVTVSYEMFASIDVTFDAVCSSVFVEKQWIEALYLPYASVLQIQDFRTTAHSQVSYLSFENSFLLHLIVISMIKRVRVWVSLLFFSLGSQRASRQSFLFSAGEITR